MKYKVEVALTRTPISDRKSQMEIESTASYTDDSTYLVTATFDDSGVDYRSYEDVQKTAKELFGQNIVVEKKTYITCPDSFFYVKEYNGFVDGQIGCGAGGGATEKLLVYNYESVNDILYIYTKLTLTGFGTAEGEVKTRTYKYTFKFQDTGYYLDNVEEI